MKISKRTKKHSPTASILLGLIINIAMLFVSVLILALISSSKDNPLGVIKLGSIIAFYICAALSSIIISAIRKDGNVIICLVSSFIMSIILLCTALFICGGSFSLISAFNYLIYCLIAFVIAKLCRTLKKRRKI